MALNRSRRVAPTLQVAQQRPAHGIAADSCSSRDAPRTVSRATLGRAEEALKNGKTALKLIEPIAKGSPGDAHDLELLAMCHINVGNALNDLRRKPEAIRHFQTANEIREGIGPSRLPGVTQRLAQGLMDEGVMLWNAKHDSEAEQRFRRAENLLLSIPIERRGADDDVDLTIGLINLNWAGLLHLSGRPQEAIAKADDGLAHVEPRLKAEPSDARAREYCLKLHGNRAYALIALDKYAEASKDWRRVVELSGENAPVGYRAFLVLTLMSAGQTAEALAQAQLMNPGPGVRPDHCYDIACMYAWAAADARQVRNIPDKERNRRVEVHRSTALRG